MLSLVYYNKVVEILETSPELKRTFKGIAQQMGCGAGGAAIGGIFGGPAGALVGGIVGAVVGYWTVDPYDSLVNVVRNLSDEEKYKLERKIQELIGSRLVEDLITFVQSEVNRQLLLNVISAEVTKGG